MSALVDDFARRYAQAIAEFVALSDEAGLERAYELGREAITQGVGVIDLAAVHARTLTEPVPTSSSETQASRRRWQFFTEALAPFEMALRGFREANDGLKASASTLEQRVSERTRDLQQSEERFRAMFNDSPLPMWTYDR